MWEHEGALGALVAFLGRRLVKVLPLLSGLDDPVLVLLVFLSLSAAFLRLDLVALLLAVLLRVHLCRKL